MALGTFLQAFDIGCPIRLLPVAMGGGFHHGSLWYDPANGLLKPEDLRGRRIGVRSYTQTTGMWVRGVLEHQFGVKSDDVVWITTEGAHVAQYVNPANAEIVAPETDLIELVHSGDLAAVIMGPKQSSGSGLQRVIPDVDAAVSQWYEENQAVPINHAVAVTEDLISKAPDAVNEVFNLLKRGIELVPDKKTPSAVYAGKDKVINAVKLAIQYSLEQKLISRSLDIDEVFAI
jgi:4,5-dihydroxyphthalate decarboxylase